MLGPPASVVSGLPHHGFAVGYKTDFCNMFQAHSIDTFTWDNHALLLFTRRDSFFG